MIAQMKYARQADRAAKLGGPMPDAPVLNHDPYADYKQCPYCDRKFSEEASKRHFEFCKKQSQRKPNTKPGVEAAMAKQNKRVLYKPPKLKKKDSVTNSNSLSSGSPTMTRNLSRNSSQASKPITAASSSKYGIKNSLQKHENSRPPPVRFSKPSSKVVELPKSCRACGIDYPSSIVEWAKFCPNCGVKR